MMRSDEENQLKKWI